MTNVAELKPATVVPNQRVIEKLESALAKAKDGRLREVLIAGSYAEGRYFHNASYEDGILLAGYLHLIMHKLISDMEQNEDVGD